MAKHLLFVFLLGIVVQAVLPSPVIANDIPSYAVRGPYPVGTLERVSEDNQRPLKVTLWYPALNPANLAEEVTYWTDPLPPMTDPLPVSGHALADAEPSSANSPYPLVIFSHGHWGFRHSSVYLTEHLASYGFVVMALDHAGDTLADLNNPNAMDAHIYRPQDISRLIDYAEDLTAHDIVLKGLIDVDNIAVIGHSFGGYTALVAAGAQLNFSEFDTLFCQDPAFISRDYGLCATSIATDRLAQIAGLNETPTDLWPSLGDDRVDAIVPLAAAQTTLFGHSGLNDVNVPALFMVGSMDFVPPEYYTHQAYELISSEQKAQVTFADAGHIVFVNACDTMPWQINEQVCSDPVWDMDEAHDLINHYVTAFCLAQLYGDNAAGAALDPAAAQFNDITYEAVGY